MVINSMDRERGRRKVGRERQRQTGGRGSAEIKVDLTCVP